MPLYDYACRACGNSFEIRQSYQEDPLTECPQCHGAIRRVINQVGVVFKGGGYYITEGRPAAGGSGGEGPAVAEPKAPDGSDAGAKDKGGQEGASTETPGKADGAKRKDASPGGAEAPAGATTSAPDGGKGGDGKAASSGSPAGPSKAGKASD
jgi:putative FmdB family regulatory protein